MLRPLLGREGLRITCVTTSKCPYISVASSPDACFFKPKVKSCMSANPNNFIGSMPFTLGNSLRKQPAFRDATTSFPAKWRLRNERRNSILMTRHYQDLGSASDWLKKISFAAQPIRSTTQIWIVTHHQYGISTYSRFSDVISWENQWCFVKYRLLSRASCGKTLSTFQNNWWNN